MKQFEVRLETLDGSEVEQEYYTTLESARKSFDGVWRNSHVEPLDLFLIEYDAETEESATLDARVIAGVNEASELLREKVIDSLTLMYGEPTSLKYFTTDNGKTIRIADHSGNPDKNGRVDVDVVIANLDVTAGRFNSTAKGFEFGGKSTVTEVVAAIVKRVNE